jgi:hypothetical protein
MSKLDRTDGTTLTLGVLGVLAAIGALGQRGSRVMSGGHHFRGEDGRMLADTSFITGCQRIPGVSIKHMGFGEFYANTPEGRVDFARGGPDFPGKVGRSHYIYGPGADWLIAEMEKAGLSTLGKARRGSKDKVQWIGHGEIYISAPQADQVQFVADRIEENYFDSDSGIRVSISFDEDPKRQKEEDGSRHWWTGHGEIYIIAPDKDLIPLTVQTIEGMAPEQVAVDVAIEQIEAEDQ